MPHWIALSPSAHADHYYRPRDGYAFAAERAVAPVLLAELAKLLPHYALGFIQQGEGYQPVAVLGLGGQRNLYVAPNGKWLGSYVPATLRGYPFTLANSEQGERVFAIDAEHLTEQTGEALFDTDGQLAGKAARTFEFLKQCEQNRQATEQAAAALAAAGVIEPWPLQVSRGDEQEPLTVQGLYRVSEQALNALSAEAYAALQGAPMALAHAQLFAMSQLNQLTERARVLAEADQQAAPVPEDLDSLFGDDEDDITFDFTS